MSKFKKKIDLDKKEIFLASSSLRFKSMTKDHVYYYNVDHFALFANNTILEMLYSFFINE